MLLLWKYSFFGIRTINVPEVIFYHLSDINRFMGFVFNFEVEVFELVFVSDSKTVLCQELVPPLAHSLDWITKNVNYTFSKYFRFVSFSIWVQFQRQSWWKTHYWRSFFCFIESIDSCPWKRVNIIFRTFTGLRCLQKLVNDSKISSYWSLIYFNVNVYHCKIWQR